MSSEGGSPNGSGAEGQVGAALPDWEPRPSPTGSTMNGHYCRIERLDSKRHGDELWKANAEDISGMGWTYLPYGPFSTADEYVRWLEKSAASDDPQFYAIIDSARRETQPAVGVASYLRIMSEVGSIEVGHIRYSPGLQRTRAATEAMYLMMKQIFEELGYRRYEWKCDALNAPSRRAAERLGFTYDGTFRQATIYKGRNRDTAWYSIVDGEWPDVRDALEAWLDPSNFDEGGAQRIRLRDIREGSYGPAGATSRIQERGP